jgi:hypothetical protein
MGGCLNIKLNLFQIQYYSEQGLLKAFLKKKNFLFVFSRAVHLYPHRFIGTVGHHEGRFPIERLDISASGEIIASISHDQRIKFWSIKYLEVRTDESFWSALKIKLQFSWSIIQNK